MFNFFSYFSFKNAKYLLIPAFLKCEDFYILYSWSYMTVKLKEYFFYLTVGGIKQARYLFYLLMLWSYLGCVAVLPSPSLPQALLLYRPDSDGLPQPWSAQPVSAEYKSPVFRGTWRTNTVHIICGKCHSISFRVKNVLLVVKAPWKCISCCQL